MKQWHELAERVQDARIEFTIETRIRLKGEPGEQATMFFLDPSGNALEFKAFEPIENLSAT
jgi:extradiol dioxygenase family protein